MVAAIIKSVDNCLLKLGPKITSFQHLMKVSFSNIRKLWMYNPPNARTHTRARMYVPSLKTKSGSNNHIHLGIMTNLYTYILEGLDRLGGTIKKERKKLNPMWDNCPSGNPLEFTF